MIPGIILAAGRSTRMGQSKALLRARIDGPTFITQLTTALLNGGVADVLIVGRPEDEALVREIESQAAASRFVPNEHADRGQLSSVLAGLNAADRPGVSGVLVTPVDAPRIDPATIRAILAAFAAHRPPIARATYRGRHGHPVVFARSVFDELRRANPDVGAKAVVRAHHAECLDVDVDDPAVVDDIDSPDDYERLINDRR